MDCNDEVKPTIKAIVSQHSYKASVWNTHTHHIQNPNISDTMINYEEAHGPENQTVKFPRVKNILELQLY